jgi:hypothetical protein
MGRRSAVRLFIPLLLLVPLAGFAQNPHQQEIQRALIQLDQRTADFARGAAPQPLDPLVGRPLHPDPEIASQLLPYERMKAAEQHELRLPPPVIRTKKSGSDPDFKPLPLPGGPRAGVDPVTLPGLPN